MLIKSLQFTEQVSDILPMCNHHETRRLLAAVQQPVLGVAARSGGGRSDG